MREDGSLAKRVSVRYQCYNVVSLLLNEQLISYYTIQIKYIYILYIYISLHLLKIAKIHLYNMITLKLNDKIIQKICCKKIQWKLMSGSALKKNSKWWLAVNFYCERVKTTSALKQK